MSCWQICAANELLAHLLRKVALFPYPAKHMPVCACVCIYIYIYIQTRLKIKQLYLLVYSRLNTWHKLFLSQMINDTWWPAYDLPIVRYV